MRKKNKKKEKIKEQREQSHYTNHIRKLFKVGNQKKGHEPKTKPSTIHPNKAHKQDDNETNFFLK